MTTSSSSERAGALASFADPSFRLVVAGASVNQGGNWLIVVGVNVLVLRLTDSGVVLGVVNALMTGPALVAGLVVGPLSDRVDRLLLVRANAAVNLAVAAAFLLMVVSRAVSLPLLLLLSLLTGATTAVDNPVRKALVGDLVGRAAIPNAVALFGTSLTAAEIVAMLGSGLLVTGPGVGWCFALGVACSVGQVGLLAAVRWRPSSRRATGSLAAAVREGIGYAATEPTVRACLALSCAVGMFGYSIHPVLLPLLATRSLHAGVGGYPLLSALVEIGCLLAGFAVSTWRVPSLTVAASATLAFGVADAALVFSRVLPAALAVAALVGAILMITTWATQSITQSVCAPELRGRVFALIAVAFSGSALVGGPLAGWLADAFGLPAAFVASGAACATVGAVVLASPRTRRGPRPSGTAR